MQNIIEVKNATVYHGTTRVFNDLTLAIPRACNTAILGPNGAGKSTLLKLLSRELYPVRHDGSYVRILGRDRWNVWDLRSHLGIVSHELQRQYRDHVRGIEVILSGYYSSIGTWPHQWFGPEEKERAGHVMDMLGVAEIKDKVFAEMSAGEQRRFLLGRALIHDPDVLVLDEPTNGLDLKACFQYLDIVRQLMRGGKTIILVTHRIHEIPPEVSHAILLKEGELVAEGEKAEVLTSENLSHLFDTPIQLVHLNGFYQAMPASE